MLFSNINRNEVTHNLENSQYDVLIIGGGITGAGIALDAVTRGMKVALIEMQDFAAGTSSRSTKLVHGGLRYLKQLEVGVVAEVGKERAIVYENGPHVTTPEWMVLPFHTGGTFGKYSTSIGLKVYDFLAGVKRSERRKMLTADETILKEPLIKKEGLNGGGYYVEYRTDDARLTIEVIKEAAARGAHLMNYVKADRLIYHDGKVVGIQAEDQLSGGRLEVRAKKVINAAGPWVDSIRKMNGSLSKKTLKLTKGVHIVLDQSVFPLKQAIYYDTPDKRMVFAIPRDGKTYVGTTDTFYQHDPRQPKITKEDRNYLLSSIHYMFPTVNISEKDIESSWAGVRPLIYEEGKDPSEISRKDEIWESDTGLITIAGGKLTGYRKMAESIVNLIAKKFKDEHDRLFSNCLTKNMPISGGDVGGSKNFSHYKEEQISNGKKAGLTMEESEQLLSVYGSNAPILFRMIEEDGQEAERYEISILLWAKLKYAIDCEMAATPTDFFYRRTGALLFDIKTVINNKEKVCNYMAKIFSWSNKEKAAYEKELEEKIKVAASPSQED
ncbi:glycerol-3-phosphate dehydrogenase/oxidase [Cytobacillus purgationiresistens]|uniref:Glycerol-3-phosphate dehydrogenase n=1 Tax=Cytobacillus purgationiresistens TaxID=863449 RepID=A0ABU0AGU7_9BACI|nr:FAD-dependent oxidoreductase [Cytobacillus purgationiresistens]MDQ0270473.1 glycerol-3-phosphate dehydrogenase [Cytobacillus purgationiresistens]